MSKAKTNPLGLEDKLYTIEEFAAALRRKFGGENTISDVILTEMFLAKYPMYSCKVKKYKNQSGQRCCNCC